MKTLLSLLILLFSLSARAQTVIEAESMTFDFNLAGPEPPGLNIWSNGTATAPFNILTPGPYRIDVVAYGERAQGIFPIMNVRVDGMSLGIPITVNGSWVTYNLGTRQLTAGAHTLSIEFTNDYYDGIEDRNLWIDRSEIFGLAAPITVQVGKFRLEWDPNAASENVAIYKIYRSDQEITYGALLGSTPQTTYEDLTVQPNHTYYYTVTATNIVNESNHSNVVVTTVGASPILPPAPTGLRRLN